MHLLRLFTVISFILLLNGKAYSQKEMSALLPVDGAVNVNTGILKWSAHVGLQYDLYFGLSAQPGLYKSDLETMEEKPVILELNKKYYWKIVEKKDGKVIGTSKVFSFSTLPITLNPVVKYLSMVDIRDYTIYWTTIINENEWFVQNLDYTLPGKSWYYENATANKVYGKLYHGHALKSDPNAICPEGWHIPSQQEWTGLINASGGIKVAGSLLKETTNLYWRVSKNQRSNKSGMTVLPAGSRDSKPDYSNLGKYTFFWTSTPSPEIPDSYYNINMGFMRDQVIVETGDPQWSYSVRCVRNQK